MARKPRKSELEKLQEELVEIQKQIEATTEKVNKLKEQEKILLSAIETQQTQELLELIQSKNMTIADVRALIEKKVQTEAAATEE